MTIHSIVIQKLLSTNAHLGKRVSTHHFKIFTYGQRNGMSIIDSDKTLISLRNACHFISLLASKNARFMFINTNPLFDEIVNQMTSKIGINNPNFSTIWKLGGFLTNNSSPKVFRSRNKRLIFGPTQLPDCVVVMDTERKSSVLLEAGRLQIPVVALVDSNMPWEFYSKITYPVPANDSVQFVYLFCNMITKSILVEQKKLKALKGGVKDDPIAIQKGNEEKVQQIEQSKIDSAIDEVLVVPFESLAPISEDIAETKKLLDKLVVIKFNGALGTDMGFSGPKSTIEVRSGLTFLDLMVNQIESLNSKYGCNVPLLLMNTITTENDTQKVLEKYSQSKIDIHSFSLSQQPQQNSFGGQSDEDALYPSDSDAVFLSLMNGGILDVLLSQGKEYVLVVNSDNAAAIVDPKILNHVIQSKIDYCMEVTPTSSYDMRNGMVNLRPGKFQLVDIVQNPAKHSVEKFKFLDTRNLWVNLKALKRLADTNSLKMEKLSTSKEVDGDQILLQATAAGSAIRLFDHAVAINVPQYRFFPMNTTSDLLLLQSDLYSFAGGDLVRNTARTNPRNPSIDLGPEFEKASDFLSRFKSIPSIIGLESLKVTGDVWFGAGITLKGRVTITAKPGMKLEIPDGTVIENKDINDPVDV